MTSADRGAPASLREVWPAVAGLAAVFLIEMMDNSVLNVALPTIGRDLHSSALGLQWVSGAYSLIFGASMLLFGGVADRFGRRRLLVIGLLLFAAASACVSLVTTSGELVAVRAVCGLSAALTAPGTMALSFRLFPDDALRARASGVITGVGMTGLAVGPLLGGAVLALAPWQALILVNVPIALLSAWAIRHGIRPDNPDELRHGPVDLVGGLLGGAGLAAGLLTPTLGLERGWHDWQPLATATSSLLLLTGFLARERHTAHPLLPLGLLRPAAVRAGLASQLGMALALAAVGFTVQLQLQYVWGWRPTLAAAGNLPQVAAMMAGGLIVEPIVKKLGLTKGGLLGSLAVVTAVIAYAALSPHGYIWIAVAMVLLALGMRIVMITSTIQVMKGLPPTHLSIASALNDTAQEVGSAIGIAVTGTILASYLTGSIASTTWDLNTVTEFNHSILIAGTGLASITLAITLLNHRPNRT